MSKFEMNKVINFFAYKYHGDWDSIYEAIQRKERIEVVDLEKFYDIDEQTNYLSIIDVRYPENYKAIYMPPLTIYYSGDINILQPVRITSLWGDIDEENLKKIFLLNNTLALSANDKNIDIALKYATKNIKFILVDFAKYNQSIVDKIKDNKNIIYITEIPTNGDNTFQQNALRMLLGISNKSVFFNTNDTEFTLYKNISNFEKRSMQVIGDSNPSYLNFATKYKISN